MFTPLTVHRFVRDDQPAHNSCLLHVEPWVKVKDTQTDRVKGLVQNEYERALIARPPSRVLMPSTHYVHVRDDI